MNLTPLAAPSRVISLVLMVHSSFRAHEIVLDGAVHLSSSVTSHLSISIHQWSSRGKMGKSEGSEAAEKNQQARPF